MNLIVAIVCVAIAMILTLALLRMLVGLVVFLLFAAAVVIAVAAGGQGHMGSGGVAMVAAVCGVIAGVVSFPLISHLMTADDSEIKKSNNKIDALMKEIEQLKSINNINGQINLVSTEAETFQERNSDEEKWASKLIEVSPEINNGSSRISGKI